MRKVERTVTTEVFVSEVRPEIEVDAGYAHVLEWADANPVAWEIVTSSRSKAWGIGSSRYLGRYQRGMQPEAILGRLVDLHDYYTIDEGLPGWSASFTLKQWGTRGRSLHGGFFQQHARYTNGQIYGRHCTTLDYTPDTLEEVTDRFLAWCGDMYRPTVHVTLDGKVIRQFEQIKSEVST